MTKEKDLQELAVAVKGNHPIFRGVKSRVTHAKVQKR